MQSYMFDTNIFNHILDGEVDLSGFVGRAKFYATHVQIDELNKTSNDGRRAALLRVFQEVSSIPVPTESAVWGVSKWNQCKWTPSDNLYQPIKSKLDQLNKNKPNNVEDALIAETAIKNGFTLVTHDCDLFRVTTEFGGACTNFRQVLKDLSGIVAG